MSASKVHPLWDVLESQDIHIKDYVRNTMEKLGLDNLKALENIDNSKMKMIRETCDQVTDFDVEEIFEVKLKINENRNLFYEECISRTNTKSIDDFNTENSKNTLGEDFGEENLVKKKTLSNLSNEFLEKLNDQRFKDQLHQKLMNILLTYVFKHNTADEVEEPVIEVGHNRLIAKVKCPECEGYFTVQTLVRKMNVKWITCNMKRHYKRHFIDADVADEVLGSPNLKKTNLITNHSNIPKNQTLVVFKPPKTDNNEAYEEISFLDSDYMEQEISPFLKINNQTVEKQEPEFFEEVQFVNESDFDSSGKEDYQEPPNKKIRINVNETENPSQSKIMEEEDEDWLFCRSLWAMMRKMSSKNKNKLKIELLTLTSERQLEDE